MRHMLVLSTLLLASPASANLGRVADSPAVLRCDEAEAAARRILAESQRYYDTHATQPLNVLDPTSLQSWVERQKWANRLALARSDYKMACGKG